MRSLLSNRSFSFLLAGRIVTNAGDSLYYVAAMWLTYELTGSSFYTGLVGMLTLAPQAFQFLAGPIVDQWRLSRLLVGAQLVQGLLVLIIPLSALSGHLTVWVLLVIMPLVAIGNQFVYPAHNAALPRLVDEEELVEANSMLAITYQGVNAVFDAAGGVLVALLGATTIFLIDSVTFALAALFFATARIPAASTSSDPTSPDSATSDYLNRLSIGLQYVRGSVIIPILVGSIVANFAFGATMAVLPAYAGSLGGADTYGFLLAAITIGSLIGSLIASPLKKFSLATLAISGYSLAGIAWLSGVAAPSVLMTILLFAAAWIPVGATNVVFMAFIQTTVPEDLVGRVVSIAVSTSVVAMPVGSLLGGAGGDLLGGHIIVAGLGLSYLGLTVYWLVHPSLRTFPAISEVEPERYGLSVSSGTDD